MYVSLCYLFTHLEVLYDVSPLVSFPRLNGDRIRHQVLRNEAEHMIRHTKLLQVYEEITHLLRLKLINLALHTFCIYLLVFWHFEHSIQLFQSLELLLDTFLILHGRLGHPLMLFEEFYFGSHAKFDFY